jgi:hypothetical protein
MTRSFLRMPAEIQERIFHFTHGLQFVNIWRALITSRENEGWALRIRQKFDFEGESIDAFIDFEIEATKKSHPNTELSDSSYEELREGTRVRDGAVWTPWFEYIHLDPDEIMEIQDREDREMLDREDLEMLDQETDTDFEIEWDSALYLVHGFFHELLTNREGLDGEDLRIGHYIYERLHQRLPVGIGPDLDAQTCGDRESEFGFTGFRLAMASLEIFDASAQRVGRVMQDFDVLGTSPETIDEALNVLRLFEYDREPTEAFLAKVQLGVDDQVFNELIKKVADPHQDKDTPRRIARVRERLNQLQEAQSQGFQYWKSLVEQIEYSQLDPHPQLNHLLREPWERYDVIFVRDAIAFAANALKGFPSHIPEGQEILATRLIPLMKAQYFDGNADEGYEEESLYISVQSAVGSIANLLAYRAPETRWEAFIGLYHSLINTESIEDTDFAFQWKYSVIYGLSMSGLPALVSKMEQKNAEDLLVSVARELKPISENDDSINIEVDNIDNDGLFWWRRENWGFRADLVVEINNFRNHVDEYLMIEENYKIAVKAFWETMTAARKTISQRVVSNKERVALEALTRYQELQKKATQGQRLAINR